MFDMSDLTPLIKLIDERDEHCYVIPLYIHINNERYNLWEMDQIDNFSKQSIKVGFGSSTGLMIPNSFPKEHVYDFEMIKTFHRYDYDKEVEIFYYVFESGNLLEEELTDVLHQQMQTYLDAISEYVEKIVHEKRIALRKHMMEDGDNYISNVAI